MNTLAFLEAIDRLRQSAPLVVRQAPRAQVRLVDAAERADHAQRQLRGAHFHREHHHRQALLHGDVLGDVERERGLAHRRPRREHDQVARLQPGGHLVEVVEAGADAGHVLSAVLGQLGHAVDQLDHQLVHRLEALLLRWPSLAVLEHTPFGFVEDLADRTPLWIEGVGGDLVAGLDQLAKHRTLAHDLGVAAQVGRARHALRQRVEVSDAAALLGLAVHLQLLEDRDHVSRLGGRHQLADRLVDQLVLEAVEVAVGQQVAGAVPGAVVQQQAAQHALFGFD